MKRVYIDGEKLKAAMLNTGIKIKTICNGIGYQSDSFIYNAKQRGYIKERAVIDLERLYGIKRKLYEIPEPKNEVKPEPIDEQIHEPMKDEKASCGLDYVQLYNTIYTAVLSALQANAKGLHEQGKLFEVK